VDGRLFFSVFQAERFVDELGGPTATRALLDEANQRLLSAGLPPMHWSGMTSTPEGAKLLKQAGFLSTSCYNVHASGSPGPDLLVPYSEVMEAHLEHWQRMDGGPLVNIPTVSMGWDSTPRCRTDVPWPFPPDPTTGRLVYPYIPVVVGNTPDSYERVLRDAAEHIQQDSKQPFALLLNAWNEWTEGEYLLPEERTGTGHLEAIRRVFGTR
jgi:hypothetical protein